jgi:membrane protein YqaA with SNARE-associated domain
VTGTAASNVNAPVLAYGAAVLATVGSLGGNIALFQAARHGRRLFGKPAPAPGSGTRFEIWFYRYGLLTVFVRAVTPVAPLPLKVFVISAGALRTRFGRLRVILAARTIRYLGLAWLGIQLGANAPDFLRRNIWTLAGVALVLALMLVFLTRWNDGRRQIV